MGLILGLDAGGSKTILAIAAADASVTRIEQTTGMDPAAGPGWKDRLGDLLRKTGVPGHEIEAAAFGLSAHGEIAAQDAVQRDVVASLAGPAAIVDNDVRIAFDGAFAGAGGVLLLCGTGSMAWASDGGTGARHVRVGGWGEAFGDEGSAFWIGREALGVATRALDGRRPGRAFADALLAAIGVGRSDLPAWASGLDDRRAGFAALARIVSGLADGGDADALGLIHAAATHVAAHAEAASRALGSETALPWSYAGGVFASPLFLDAVTAAIGTPPVPPRLPPIGGALLRAAASAGWRIDDGFVDRLATSLADRLPVSPFP